MLKYLKNILFLIFLLITYSSQINASIVGKGASYPYPYFEHVFDIYQKETEVAVNYSPTGSRNGYLSLKDLTVDFAAIDLYLSDSLIQELPSPDIVHFPISLSGIGIAFSLPNISDLNLNASVLSEILIGNIVSWDDKKIAELNPNIQLPNLKIIVITRDSGSGSTFILSQFLSYLNPAWNVSFGVTPNLDIPGTLTAQTSEDMGELITQIPGSIGYIGLAYNKEFDLRFAAMQNSSGNYVKPSNETLTEAASLDIPEDGRVSCIFTDMENGYPLTSFSWMIVYREQFYNQRSKKHVKQFYHFLSWMIEQSNKFNPELDFPILPKNAVENNMYLLHSITYKGGMLRRFKNQ